MPNFLDKGPNLKITSSYVEMGPANVNLSECLNAKLKHLKPSKFGFAIEPINPNVPILVLASLLLKSRFGGKYLAVVIPFALRYSTSLIFRERTLPYLCKLFISSARPIYIEHHNQIY